MTIFSLTGTTNDKKELLPSTIQLVEVKRTTICSDSIEAGDKIVAVL